uniref:Cadherin domain-containing protein n=1 Tax=Oncorhynchus kisutch TaxID=8019 RepID=A0A8C7J264_ONCKI
MAAAIFRIDQNTGQLTVSVLLDREQQDVHRLTVVGTLRYMADVDCEKQERYELDLLATNNGRPSPLTSVARVTVFIEDVNDNQPQVILPSSNLSCLTISKGTTTGTMVTKIYAIDEDSGLNSEIKYTIAASSSPFQLDARSSNVTLAQRLMAPLHTTVWVNLLVNDTLEPCHLETLPRSLPYRLAQTPSEKPAETPACDRHARLILLVGLGIMVASLCLFLVTVVLYMKQRKRSRGERQQRRGVNENQIPLRIQERYSSGEAL